MSNDLAAALAAVRTRRAELKEDEEAELHDPGPVDDEAEEEADAEGIEDAARRSREASLSRTQLVDYAQFRGVRLSHEEQTAPMNDLRKVVLERLAALAMQ